MDSDSRSYLFTAIILLFLAAFFALAETAVSSVSVTKVRARADRGDPRAVKALYVLSNFESAVSTLLICTNIVHISAASLVTVCVTRTWGLSAVTAGTLITTVLIFFFGEMLPKSAAKKRPLAITLMIAGIISVLMKILSPVSGILSKIGRLSSKLMKQDQEVSVTEEEIQDIIEDLSEDGAIDAVQADLLSSALEFTKKKAAGIMTCMDSVASVNISDTPENVLEYIKRQNHSRVPVYDGDPLNVVGMLQIRKVFKAWMRKGRAPQFRPLLDKVCFAEPDEDINDLLEKMSSEKCTLAVVRERKNGGKALGIVTVEDILEELVGEIYDEEDKAEGDVI